MEKLTRRQRIIRDGDEAIAAICASGSADAPEVAEEIMDEVDADLKRLSELMEVETETAMTLAEEAAGVSSHAANMVFAEKMDTIIYGD